jgi:protein-S-isoprenylcysteine O-methyltransferase Ste14
VRGTQALATALLMMAWALLGGALLAARLRARRAAGAGGGGAAASGPPARRDLQSWGGIALQGLGFALVWGTHPGGAPFWPGTSLPAQQALAIAGAALGMLSSAFAVLAIRELGKQWSLTARVLNAHELVSSGPFARVRHPIYTGLLGLLVGTGLALSTAPATGLGLLAYLAGTWWRTASEEALLRAHFGAAYEDYARRVPRLLPRPWRRA